MYQKKQKLYEFTINQDSHLDLLRYKVDTIKKDLLGNFSLEKIFFLNVELISISINQSVYQYEKNIRVALLLFHT